MKANNRIVYNTAITYGQLVVNCVLNLLVIRFVLKALGESDYGIYAIVAGVISMLNVFTASMSHASMRYMGHSLGTGDKNEIKKTFNTAMFIHFVLAIGLVVLLELGGFVMFQFFLNIPDDRLLSAKIVYQFMVISTYVSTIAIPYDSVINAHENLSFMAIVSVSKTFSDLILALLLFVFDIDLLIAYGAGKMIIQIGERLIKQSYSKRKYEECRLNIKTYKDRKLLKSMLSFTGWELFATLAHICMTQMRSVLINVFFGVRLNAGEGIGTKVKMELNMVSVGITKAITPQMNKSEGGGERNRLIKLTNMGIKYTTFMFAFVAMPVFIEAHYLLGLWLGEIPSYAEIFTQLAIIIQMCDKFTWQISNALRAVGQIKEFQIIQGLSAIVGVVIAYVFVKNGASPEYIYYSEIAVVLFNGCARIFLGYKIVDINPYEFIKTTTLPVLLPMAFSIGLCYLLQNFMCESFMRLLITFLVFSISYTTGFLSLGMKSAERKQLWTLLTSLIKKK